VDTLELVEGGQVLRGQRHGLASHEDVRERLLHLEDDLAPEVDELVAGDLGRRLRAVDASLPLAPELDGLADVEGVLSDGHIAATELLGEEVRDRIGPEGRRDLVGPHRLDFELLGADGGIGRAGEAHRLVEREAGHGRLGGDGRRRAHEQ
jgi:hypothetical protein